MTKDSTANLIILGLAAVGAVVILPGLVNVMGGLLGLAIVVVSWMIAGMLAGRILRGRGYGPLADIGLGFIGGLLGSLVLTLLGQGWVLGIPILGGILTGVVGALLFVWLVRLIANSNFAR